MSAIRKFVLAFTAAIALPAMATPFQDVLKEYGIAVPGSFKILKDQKMSGAKTQRLIEVESNKSERIEIKIVSPVEPSSAQDLIDSERSAVKKLYAAPQTPYMGDIAQAIGSCPTKFGPLKSEIDFLSAKQDALIGAANPERTFGACSADQAKFRGAFMSYYDAGTKTVWSWRIFSPWTDKKPLGSNWLGEILAQFHNEISVR